MGLDMYWFAGLTKEEKTEALITSEDTNSQHELGYFRKFHELNDFMCSLYPHDLEDCNTVELEIDWDVLAEMRKFQSVEASADTPDEYIALCDSIEHALKEGRRVVYWPWW